MSSLIEYLESIDTPTLSNAIELLGIRPRSEGFTPLQVRCLFPEFGTMVGYAVTAQVETMTQTTPTGWEGHYSLYHAVECSPKPAIVVMQEVGPHPDFAAHCGEVMTTFFQRLGAVGVVSDAGVRDLPEVRSLGFHYFARGAVASHAYAHIVKTGGPIEVCGMPVRQGDILHGDENGLISVPPLDIAQLEAAVKEIRSRERRIMDYVRGSEFKLQDVKAKVLE